MESKHNSKISVRNAGRALWGKFLIVVGFVALFLVGSPRVFKQVDTDIGHDALLGPDIAHADVPACAASCASQDCAAACGGDGGCGACGSCY